MTQFHDVTILDGSGDRKVPDLWLVKGRRKTSEAECRGDIDSDESD